MKPEHYDHLKQSVAPHVAGMAAYKLSLIGHTHVRLGDFEKVARANLIHRAGATSFVKDELLAYLTMDDVHTALKKIVEELKT